MTEEGKVYWLALVNSPYPQLYLGETKQSRGKYMLLVMKPSCCLAFKGGPKLDKYIADTNDVNQKEFDVAQAAFDLKYPPGTPPAELSPTLRLYKAVEVVKYKNKGKEAYKVKKPQKQVES
jgi:hypothetical protein